MYYENPAQRAWNFNHLHFKIISGDLSFSGLTLKVAVRLILTDSDFIYQTELTNIVQRKQLSN